MYALRALSARSVWARLVLPLALLTCGARSDAKDAPAAPAVEFLDAEQAAKAIGDEGLEPYFALLQPAEMQAKTGGEPLAAGDLSAQREECRERYRKGVRAFSDEERQALTALAARLHGAWASAYPRIADLPWSFLGVEDSIEGGLPHTRGKSIVLSRTVGAAIARSATAPPAAQREQLELLAHEQAHVLQRLEPALFVPLYQSWGFLRAEGLGPAPAILPRHVVNPDGVRTEWVFPLRERGATTYLHPLVAFADKQPPYRMPDDFVMIAVELLKDGTGFKPRVNAGGQPVVRPLDGVTEYGAHFGGIGENFHPNEIFAVAFSTMVVQDAFGGAGLPASSEVFGKDFAKLRAWCAKNLGRKTPAAVR